MSEKNTTLVIRGLGNLVTYSLRRTAEFNLVLDIVDKWQKYSPAVNETIGNTFNGIAREDAVTGAASSAYGAWVPNADLHTGQDPRENKEPETVFPKVQVEVVNQVEIVPSNKVKSNSANPVRVESGNYTRSDNTDNTDNTKKTHATVKSRETPNSEYDTKTLPSAETMRQINAVYNAKKLEDEKAITDQYNKLTMSEKEYAIWALEEKLKAYEEYYHEKLGLSEKFETIKKKQQSSPSPQSDLSLAPGVAVKQIQSQAVDYAKPMVQAYNEINASAENHWVKMLSGQESFSKGMQSITKDLTQSITQMWIKMMYQQYIYQPLQNWFTGMIGGSTSSTASNLSNTAWSGYTSLDSSTWPSSYSPTFSLSGKNATGGPVSAGGLYLVGEKQPELFVPDQSGRIYPSVNSFMSQQASSASSTPSVTVNVYDRSGSNVQVSKQARWDGSAQRMIVEMFIDAKERNVMGLRDALATG